MFPNVRLMIVAISASLLAIFCAMALFMGMFAAFSVAHEPFSGITAAKPPLQIAFADQVSGPIVDGKPAPFGARFQVNVPQISSGPVIVPVPAALNRISPPEIPVAIEPISNPAANAQASAPAESSSFIALPQDDAQAPQLLLQEAPAALQPTTGADDRAGEAKSDAIAGDAGTTATIRPPVEPPAPERSAVQSAPRHGLPQIRIVSREADNPASVTTSPAPTTAQKGLKRRKLAAHLRQSHHFRRPRLPQVVPNQGYPQTNGFVQPNAFSQAAVPNYTSGASYGQQSSFIQAGFGFTPAATKPKQPKARRAAVSPTHSTASP